jgi:methyl-accepting chemotaxis protein
LVGNAGEALSEIITQVNDIASMTSQIATSAEEQSIGLSEINIGVNQLDQVTQQNAAMVQESISRGDSLAQETEKLSDLIGQFRVSGAGKLVAAKLNPSDALTAAIAKTHQVKAPTQAPQRRAVGEKKGTAAIWEDF